MVRAAAPVRSSATRINHLTVAPRTTSSMPSNLPNLRRLFVEARSDAEESAYSRKAFYNLAIFVSSIAVFSLVAQRMGTAKVMN